MIVQTWRGRQEASESLFWHVVPSSGFWAEAFFGNVRVGKGELFSVSIFNEVHAGTTEALTEYGKRARTDEKERTLEQVRRERFPQKPPRRDALFMFDDREVAEAAGARWFLNEKRVILEARILAGAKLHRGDAKWLDLAEHHDHKECALAYWRGEMTPQAQPEIIVHGRVFFPQWRDFPTENEIKAGKLRKLVEEIEESLTERS